MKEGGPDREREREEMNRCYCEGERERHKEREREIKGGVDADILSLTELTTYFIL